MEWQHVLLRDSRWHPRNVQGTAVANTSIRSNRTMRTLASLSEATIANCSAEAADRVKPGSIVQGTLEEQVLTLPHLMHKDS